MMVLRRIVTGMKWERPMKRAQVEWWSVTEKGIRQWFQRPPNTNHTPLGGRWRDFTSRSRFASRWALSVSHPRCAHAFHPSHSFRCHPRRRRNWNLER
jgi:hypothetical protein